MANRWQVDLLAYIGAPNVGGNVDVLTMWADSEGVAPWANNWLATSWKTLNSVSYNDAGVQAYPDQLTGVESIGDTLLKSDPAYGYGLIVAGFREQIGPSFQMWDYINKSSWCSGCNGGFYPNVFYAWLQGQGLIEQGVSGGGPTIPDLGSLAPGVKQAWDGLRTFAGQGASDLGVGLSWIKDAIDQVQ